MRVSWSRDSRRGKRHACRPLYFADVRLVDGFLVAAFFAGGLVLTAVFFALVFFASAVFAAASNASAAGAPALPGFLIFSPLPWAIRSCLAWMLA